MRKLMHAIRFIEQHGHKRFLGELRDRAFNAYQERRLNVQTSSMLTSIELTHPSPECLDYVPLGYAAIYRVLKRLPQPEEESVFLDYGAGKGRAVTVAATFPYKRVIGVELSPDLVQMARTNVSSMKRREAKDVEIVQCDAMQYQVPPDVTVIYMFNPFRGEILRAVLSNIQQSLAAAPRRLFLVAVNNSATIDALLGQQGWLRKTDATSVYPGYPCGIYCSATA